MYALADIQLIDPGIERICIIVGTIILIYMQNKAAKKVDVVKQDLHTATEEQNRKLDQQDVKMDVIYHQGNGLRGSALRTIALQKRIIAERDPQDVRARVEAEQAEHEAERHEKEQDELNRAIAQRIAQAKFAPAPPPAKRAASPKPLDVVDSEPLTPSDAPEETPPATKP